MANVNVPLAELTALGQSVWLDYIRRDLLESGQLAQMIEEFSIRGETSNPTIFDKAIADTNLYDTEVGHDSSDDPETIFFNLAIADIQSACDIFSKVFSDTGGSDGFVSLEVSPRLAYQTDKTHEQAKQLWGRVDRPNLMVKIPGTEAGIPAIEATIAVGVNVNVTLLFSVERHMEAADAYVRGLERANETGIDLSTINSVASFFVSRVDTLVDKQLDDLGAANDLRGLAAVANAKIAYQAALEKFSGPRWEALAAQGAKAQRPLWASTSTKNPAYSDVKYVADLIGPGTVNTVPEKTIHDFADHGVAVDTLGKDVDGAYAEMGRLAEAGIVMDDVTAQLESEGVDSFTASYEELLAAITAKRKQLEQSR